MKRIIAFILISALLLSLVGCSKNSDESDRATVIIDGADGGETGSVTEAPDSTTTTTIDSTLVSGSASTKAPSGGAATDTPKAPGADSGEAKGEGSGSYKEDAEGSIIETGDYVIEGAVTSDTAFIPDSALGGGSDSDSVASPPVQHIQAGTLTAGEWNDAENFDKWSEVIRRDDWIQILVKRNFYMNEMIPVNVVDEDGNPCYNAKVVLKDANKSIIYNAVTDVYGNAYLFHDAGAVPAFVKVGDKEVPINKDGVTNIVADGKTLVVKQLDLMLMVDTTGSMGDELNYLKEELDYVIKQVSAENEALSIRVSVNFYRDKGDEYVVRESGFTENINEAVAKLEKQSAAGGGDYPEAVHDALDSIVNNRDWRDNAVKICFFVLDAPPHSEAEVQSINSEMKDNIKKMAKLGIRLIPVASSGVDTETECLLRSWALMTGGTYTFLTNHSGVGNSHLEPTVGEYEVEKLNALMIRLIKEYCGIK